MLVLHVFNWYSSDILSIIEVFPGYYRSLTGTGKWLLMVVNAFCASDSFMTFCTSIYISFTFTFTYRLVSGSIRGMLSVFTWYSWYYRMLLVCSYVAQVYVLLTIYK